MFDRLTIVDFRLSTVARDRIIRKFSHNGGSVLKFSAKLAKAATIVAKWRIERTERGACVDCQWNQLERRIRVIKRESLKKFPPLATPTRLTLVFEYRITPKLNFRADYVSMKLNGPRLHDVNRQANRNGN